MYSFLLLLHNLRDDTPGLFKIGVQILRMSDRRLAIPAFADICGCFAVHGFYRCDEFKMCFQFVLTGCLISEHDGFVGNKPLAQSPQQPIVMLKSTHIYINRSREQS